MRQLVLGAFVCSLLAGAAMAQTPVPAPIAPNATIPAAVHCVGAQGLVYFDVGSIALSRDSDAALRDLATARHAGFATQITVTGHTDNTGSVRRNRQLAQQRATAVQQQLVAFGVPQEEIAIGGAGETALQSATDDRLNRRVTIVLAASPRTPLVQPVTAAPVAADPG
jgi:OmpA-OmpF porin, OOP family